MCRSPFSHPGRTKLWVEDTGQNWQQSAKGRGLGRVPLVSLWEATGRDPRGRSCPACLVPQVFQGGCPAPEVAAPEVSCDEAAGAPRAGVEGSGVTVPRSSAPLWFSGAGRGAAERGPGSLRQSPFLPPPKASFGQDTVGERTRCPGAVKLSTRSRHRPPGGKSAPGAHPEGRWLAAGGVATGWANHAPPLPQWHPRAQREPIQDVPAPPLPGHFPRL